MEAIIEVLVGSYLTRNGRVFINPQFDIVWDKIHGEGGRCPDFLAVDLENKEFIIVEVTISSNLKNLFERINQRDQHWYRPVRRHLESIRAIDDLWKPRFIGFIRKGLVPDAGQEFNGAEDVTFYPIEDALLEYAYSEDRKKGLPRRPQSSARIA